MKPLFIPLKTEYFDAFKRGDKTREIRKYGPRWNEKTCVEGRKVILSKGYSGERLNGTVTAFHRQHARDLPGLQMIAFLACYGSAHIEVALITIELEASR